MEAKVFEKYYIDYLNMLHHNYIMIPWNEEITLAWVNKPIFTQNGKIIPKEEVNRVCNKEMFRKTFNNYKCFNCNSILNIDDSSGATVAIRLISNDKIIQGENIPGEVMVNDVFNCLKRLKNLNFKKILKKNIFHLSCKEMQIKNLLE